MRSTINIKVWKKHLFLLFITFIYVVFLSCSNPVYEKIETPKTIMLIPMDDRPINQYVPEQLAKASGMKLVIPPAEVYNVSDHLVEWILAYPDLIDGYILSIDMLVYGGLVQSRKLNMEKENAIEKLSIIYKLKDQFPERPIYAYSTIPRLTITVEQEEDLPIYEKLRKWSILRGKDSLTIEEMQEVERLEGELPSHLTQEFIEVRERSLEINKEVLLLLEQEHINYLLIGQDDAANEGIHLLEKQILREFTKDLGVEDKVILLDGADELDLLLIARMKSSFDQIVPSFHTYYTGIHGSAWTAPLEGQSLEHNLVAHLKAAGATRTESANKADIQLIIHTPNELGDENVKPDTVDLLEELLQQFKHLAIADVAILNKADSVFMESLLQSVDPTSLISYSSWNTASNTLGIVIAHASARYSFLQQEETFSEESLLAAGKAHIQLLFHRFSKDYLYKTILYPELKTFCQKMEVSPYDLQDQFHSVNDYVDHNVSHMATQFYKTYFHGHTFQVGSKKGQELDAIIVGMEDIHIQLPWHRIFEADIEPNLEIEILNDNKE